MTITVPEDFPLLVVASALGGVQLKFSVIKDRDGMFREVGASLADRERDYARCNEVLEWGIDFVKKVLEAQVLSIFQTGTAREISDQFAARLRHV